MPHTTQMQLIKRRLTGKEGSSRLRELRSILEDLPDYKNGPYADIRKWVTAQMGTTRARSRVVQRDSLAVRREGAAQIALVGPPNAGKSSLLQALSEIQIKVGNYAFTTLRPVPALVRIGGVLVQFVEIPGLLEGASQDRGGGRALLGVLRNADAVIFCHEVTGPRRALEAVRAEVAAAGIDLPAVLALTKVDEVDELLLTRAVAAWTDIAVVPVSIIDDTSLEALKQAAWRLTGLMRIFLRRGRIPDDEPLAMPYGATVLEVAGAIHKELALSCTGARVWGLSARFPGQMVGPSHRLADSDVVEILAG